MPATRQSPEVTKALMLVAKGMTAYAAAKKVGIALSTIYRAIERNKSRSRREHPSQTETIMNRWRHGIHAKNNKKVFMTLVRPNAARDRSAWQSVEIDKTLLKDRRFMAFQWRSLRAGIAAFLAQNGTSYPTKNIP